MNEEDKVTTQREKHKRKKLTIIVAFALSALVLIICALLSDLFDNTGAGGDEIETFDQSRFCETKEEDFDIFEYPEYLKYDRSIYYNDERSGIKLSITEEDAAQYGEGVYFAYNLINIIVNGDYEEYNSLVGGEAQKYESFTQQQLYDINLSLESTATLTGNKNNTYTEYVVKVQYKIHENNGTYRRDVESDASKPQYYVINNSTGSFLLMDVVFTKYIS